MPSLNAKVDNNQITIEQDGDYEIIYRVKIISPISLKFAVSARKNSISIPASKIEQTTIKSLSENEYIAEFSNLIIETLSKNDVVDLAITPLSENSATITVPENGDIVLVVKKLNTTI